MKMEYTMRVLRDGRLGALHVTLGDRVEADALLAETEPET
ncbi:biotin carboxyl carrier protein [Aureimonas pseudogalii]|uniref:Biotin carboxyl carrier protein n=1 Tax=Aureimonas pseudogalii TaxID=1744844 RepID=A0A7W6EGL4_9HYPH|nr:biotin carboxyl carrier protein [Aureimonas pseudogalii]